MGRRAMTMALYDALLKAFRLTPGNFHATAKVAGCVPSTAKRGWELGWPDRWAEARPIKVVFAEEQAAARLASEKDVIVKLEQEERRRADEREAAIRARTTEGKMVNSARDNARGLSVMVGEALQGAIPMVKKLRVELEQQGAGLSINDKLRVLRELNTLTKVANEAVRLAIVAERLFNGDPTEVIEHRIKDDMTLEEAVKEIERASAAAERARDRGLVLVSGGAAQGGSTEST